MSATKLIQIQKTFPGGVHALENINLDIKSGEFISILGPSGCGKSTLLRIIAGLEQPSSGKIETTFNKKDLAFVFQESYLIPWRNIFKNVVLPLELANQTDHHQVMASLEKLGIGDASQLYPHQLSGGMKMRASLARALVKKPKLLLLDEPFAALDELIRQKLSEELRQLWNKEKMTIVFVTHSLTEACFLSDRVIVLSPRPGKMISDIKINLPHQRNQETRTTAEFSQQLNQLYKAVGTQNEK